MNISIHAIDFSPRRELNEFIEEKLSALSRLKKDIISGEVTLKLEKNDAAGNKVCEIRLVVPGNDLFASRQCKTFEESSVLVIDALEKQIIRANDRERENKN